jgi:uncharacterized protein (TIGR03083 family)
MIDHASCFRELRSRVISVVESPDIAALNAVAPATPEWRVRDVLAHLTGVCNDIVTGNLEGVTTDPWTAAHVAARADWSLAELTREWEERGIEVERIMRQSPELSEWNMFMSDAATHEHDIRGGLGLPGARDSEAVVHAANSAVNGIGQRLSAVPGGCIRFEFGDHDVRVAGSGDPATTVRASRFEIFRAATGRRSPAQMSGYDWTPVARPEWLVLPIFSPRATDLVE